MSSGDFGKSDGLGVVDDHDVLARQIAGIEQSLRAAHTKIKKGDAAPELDNALSSMALLNTDIKLTRKRLVHVEEFILGLSRFVDSGKLKAVLSDKDSK
jgi:hypothetical protein